MNNPITRRWAGVAILWFLVALFLVLDLSAIGRIARTRRAHEERKWHLRFVDEHAGNMTRAIDRSRAFSFDSPSFALAKLTIEDTIQQVARSAGVRDLLAEYRLRSVEQSLIDLSLTFSAPVAEGIRFVDSVEHDCPHLRVESVSASRAGESRVLEYELEIGCEVRIREGATGG